MSITSSEYTGGMRIIKYDNSKILLLNNTFDSGDVNNDDYEDLEIVVGTLMGRISATGLLTPLTSGASDGSQYPVGVSVGNYTIPDGDTVSVRICTGGEIDSSKVVFQGSDTLETVVDGRRLRDRIGADTVGLVLRTVDELSEFDND